MARAIAAGTISFGLVAIPVKLFSTSESGARIQFNSIHEACGTRIRQQLYCPTDEVTVARDELVKGYEFAKDQYVTFKPEELKAIEVPSTQSIDIKEFVPLDQVDPLYFEKAYYLGPDKGGAKPYALLSEAMKATGRAALARYSARGKDYLVLLRPFEDGIVMQQLRYSDEIRGFDDVDSGESEVDEAELALAVQLVEQIASDTFNPEGYSDSVKDKILAAIEQKVAGQELTFAAKDEPKAQVIDLMAALKASLGDEGDTAPTKAGSAAPRKRKPTKKAASAKAPSAPTSKRKPAKKASSATPAKKRANAKK
ncbi:MAG: Ku protein [Acidimicrobiia bacterium]